MSNHLSRALTVVKATTRLKLLAKHARQARELERSGSDTIETTAERSVSRPVTAPASRATSLGGRLDVPFLQPEENGNPDEPLTPMVKAFQNPFTRDIIALREMICSSYLSIFLLCWPLGLASYFYHWGIFWDFCLNFVALIPLALVLGDITEDLAGRFGSIIGGLINATFGNVVELVISIVALEKGLYDVVSTSLLGSILSNLLLVLGCCFLFGGIRYRTQNFNELAITACSSLLFLASIALMIPTVASRLVVDSDAPKNWILDISRGTAIILLILYFCFLGFQLYTHHDLFVGEEEEEEEPVMTIYGAFAALTAISIAVAVSSEILSDAIKEGAAEQVGMSRAFLSMIILPIAGNACEHLTAVLVAVKGKMDLSLGIAIGSSIQIAIFAIPFTVLFAWATGHQFALDFDPFATICLALSVIHANIVTSGANSNWLLGVQLISVYILIALTYMYR